MQEDPSHPRKALLKAAKRRVTDEDGDTRLTELQSLPKQGQMMASAPPDTASHWAKVIQTLPPEQTKFALNAAVDTLLHNSNLQLWKDSRSCPVWRMSNADPCP